MGFSIENIFPCQACPGARGGSDQTILLAPLRSFLPSELGLQPVILALCAPKAYKNIFVKY
jgi:hypothetical protein